jgi:polyisoprenoid-binding protein YceI
MAAMKPLTPRPWMPTLFARCRLPMWLALPCLAAPAWGQTVVPEGSEIRFVTTQMGVPVEGGFSKWQAQVRFDPRQPAAATVAISIDIGSVRFGAADTEAEAAKPDWFHSARFPQAQFRSTAVKEAGGGRFEVRGQLQIKGQTHEVTVPVTLARGPAPGEGVASGRFALKRLNFQLGVGEWADTSVVADEVQVRFRLRLTGLAAP